jgi:predicted transcriptional regulator of viral defense system
MEMRSTVLTALPSTLTDPVRLFHGVAVERRDWAALGPLERRRLVVRARAARLQADGVVSHWSAAALWGLPELDRTDWRLHVVDPRATKTHAGRGVVRHVGSVGEDDVVLLDGLRTTSLLRTVIDVARTSTFDHAVVVLDHVLHIGGLDRRRS